VGQASGKPVAAAASASSMTLVLTTTRTSEVSFVDFRSLSPLLPFFGLEKGLRLPYLPSTAATSARMEQEVLFGRIFG